MNTITFIFISGEWVIVQGGELQGIKQAVGALTVCVNQFTEQQQHTAKVYTCIQIYYSKFYVTFICSTILPAVRIAFLTSKVQFKLLRCVGLMQCVTVSYARMFIDAHMQTEVDKQTSELMVLMLLPLLQQLTELITQHSTSIVRTSTELRDQVQYINKIISL